MAKHNETGIKGEELAQNFLLKKGYKILNCNWRWERKEIDIVAEVDSLLVFVEVKTRATTYFGFPEDAVDFRKQDFMKLAAEEYMYQHPQYTRIRFDVISIISKNGMVREIQHFEDAFF